MLRIGNLAGITNPFIAHNVLRFNSVTFATVALDFEMNFIHFFCYSRELIKQQNNKRVNVAFPRSVNTKDSIARSRSRKEILIKTGIERRNSKIAGQQQRQKRNLHNWMTKNSNTADALTLLHR